MPFGKEKPGSGVIGWVTVDMRYQRFKLMNEHAEGGKLRGQHKILRRSRQLEGKWEGQQKTTGQQYAYARCATSIQLEAVV